MHIIIILVYASVNNNTVVMIIPIVYYGSLVHECAPGVTSITPVRLHTAAGVTNQ